MTLWSLCAGNAAHNKACTLKKDPGNCEDASTKWYYDSKTNSCKLFVYGGCDGNDNRFDTEAKCKTACVREYDASDAGTGHKAQAGI
ncbi:hypothetical protein HPB52_002495 [Rhipicephalus sanguineus]|uniref:BPTI/Kunitz inhibitor domain-containing protein n=1 Tax=Rhipicephalus sanguineus TaxID=34632 RepID=A0A9D4QFV3_RHISA|nr:hypothetical protein HPB52_002495 [Rhipicephalus sanguineus]